MFTLFFCFMDIISDPVYERPEQSELRRQYSQQTLSNYKFVRHLSKLKDQAISNEI